MAADDPGPIPPRLAAAPGHPWHHPHWSRRADVLLDGERLRFVVRADSVEGWAEVIPCVPSGRGNDGWKPVVELDGTLARAVLRGRVEFVEKPSRGT